MAKKLITLAIGLILIWLLASCGSAYHLRRAEHHIKKAERKGGKWFVDTAFHTVRIKTDPVRVKFDPKPIMINDTVYYERDIPNAEQPVRVKIIYKKDSTGTTTAEPVVDIPEVEKKEEVPVTVVKTIEAKQSIRWWWLLISAGLGFLSGVFLMGRKRG